MTWTIVSDSGEELQNVFVARGEPIEQQQESIRFSFPGSDTVSVHQFGERAPVSSLDIVLLANTEAEAESGKGILQRMVSYFATLSDSNTGRSYRIRFDQPVRPQILRGAASVGGATYNWRIAVSLAIEVVG